MNFQATYQGKVYAMTNGTLYDFSDGYLKGVQVSGEVDGQAVGDRVQVALTGFSVTSKKGTVGYQTRSGQYIILSEGWQEIGQVAIAQYSQSKAQALANKIIKNDQQIIRNNLLCARYASKLTEAQQSAVRTLQNRLQARKYALQSEGLTTNVQTGYPTEYAELSGYLDALMQGEAIGVATWVVVVIAVTVLAATATAAYYTYKKLADESEQDLKYSKELTSVLVSKLTEEEYQQLLDETKGMLTKAKIKQLVRGDAKWLLFAGVGLFAWYYISKWRNA